MLRNESHISVNIGESYLKERNRDFAFLMELRNLLSVCSDVKSILDGALEIVLPHFEMDSGRIYLLNESGDYLHLAAYRGIDPEGLEGMSIWEGFSGKAVLTKCFIAQYVSEMKNKKRAELLRSKGLRIVICVPLISMDKVGGVMNLGVKDFISLDEGKIDLLTIVGNQIAVAVNGAKLYEVLEEKIRSLNEKNEMIKIFSYSISHDLKSPAVGIYGLTKRLQEKYGAKLDRRGQEYCHHIMNAAEQMVSLVEKINAYIASKETAFHFEKIDMAQIIQSIKNEFWEKISGRHIKWSEPAFYPEIVADRLAILRVFRNFTDNALKYGGDSLLELKIGYEEHESFHVLSFSDDGTGLNKGDQEKIFEQFQRKSTSGGHEGLGLGLAIVKEIAERHGGRVWIEDRLKPGTTFCISLSKALEPCPVAA